MSRRNSLDINKTLKVSGLLKLLEDQLEKEFQSTGNSTGFHDDVAHLCVCPKGQDYALVEFVNDLPSGNDCIVYYSAELSQEEHRLQYVVQTEVLLA